MHVPLFTALSIMHSKDYLPGFASPHACARGHLPDWLRSIALWPPPSGPWKKSQSSDYYPIYYRCLKDKMFHLNHHKFMLRLYFSTRQSCDWLQAYVFKKMIEPETEWASTTAAIITVNSPLTNTLRANNFTYGHFFPPSQTLYINNPAGVHSLGSRRGHFLWWKCYALL